MSAAFELTDFVPISLARLVPTAADVGLDLYRRDQAGQRPVLYRGSNFPLRQSDIETLRERGFENLYITRTASKQYRIYLRDFVGLNGPPREAPLTSRISALNEVVRDVLRDSFRSADTDETVKTAKRLSELATEILCHDDFDEAELFRVLHHDSAAFTHSANVAFYAGILANRLGFADGEVNEIITGGLLHDLGKLEIANRILDKPTRLDEEEFREVQRHPIAGIQKIAHRSDLTEGQLMMLYQHHERLDGTGYPVGLVGNEIHPWARLCSVVDVFEALTSRRAYRQPKAKKLVLELLQRGSAKSFDPEILACWVKTTRSFWQS